MVTPVTSLPGGVPDPFSAGERARPKPGLGGLRVRVAMMLLGLMGLVLLVSLYVGSRWVEDMRGDLAESLARDRARITQQRILAKVGQELALSRRLAESAVFTEWLADERNVQKQSRAWREAERFRLAFSDGNWFSASLATRHFHYADTQTPAPRLAYSVQEGNPENAWFFNTLASAGGQTINVDYDKHVEVTKVWINVVARDPMGQSLGVVGTGLELTGFLAELLGASDKDAMTMIVDRNGAVVAHPDTRRMEFDLARKERAEKTLFRMTPLEDGERLKRLLADAGANADAIPTLVSQLEGHRRLLALAGAPTLGWTVVTAVDLDSSTVLTPHRLLVLGLTVTVLLTVFLVVVSAGLDRLVLAPLAKLSSSVRRIASGQYDVRLQSHRSDELGELTRSFDAMAQQVRAYSENLEHLVEKRTEELAQAHQRLTDSIQYARLIQNTILPDALLAQHAGDNHFVVWQPRDLVGGDFHFFRTRPTGSVFGVIDCAGHGVPGACMTMATHPAVSAAVEAGPWDDPAGILARVDAALRANLRGDARIVTSVDAGFCCFDAASQRLVFSGAHLSLFWSDGEGCHEVAGHRRSLNDRKPGAFANVTLTVTPDRVFYLVSDGLLDQSGGVDGHAYGSQRFKAWIMNHIHLPLPQQRAALVRELDVFQGSWPRRDDITVLAFRFGPQPHAQPHDPFNTPS